MVEVNFSVDIYLVFFFIEIYRSFISIIFSILTSAIIINTRFLISNKLGKKRNSIKTLSFFIGINGNRPLQLQTFQTLTTRRGEFEGIEGVVNNFGRTVARHQTRDGKVSKSSN